MRTKRPFIVICNDDGIYAKGLKALWESLHKSALFDLAIIAPSSERSGTGSAITWDKPILIEKIEWEEQCDAWAIGGTPADCIKMARTVILKKMPDLIVSGINAGSNAGRNILHSGTIGAVIEGVLRGIPGIAFSCENDKNPNFSIAQKHIVALTQYILAHPLPEGSFLNVNFPHNVVNDVKGFKMTKQGRGRWVEDPSLHMETARGSTYWLGGKPEERTEDPEGDIAFLREGYITAVPIHIHELTDKATLKERQIAFSDFFTPFG